MRRREGPGGMSRVVLAFGPCLGLAWPGGGLGWGLGWELAFDWSQGWSLLCDAGWDQEGLWLDVLIAAD